MKNQTPKKSKTTLDLSEDEGILVSSNHNNKFNNNNFVAKIKINNNMNGGKKQSIEGAKAYRNIAKILNTNNNIHHNNIIAKIEINNYYTNESPEKNDGSNYNNIYNKKSQISKGNNCLLKLNNNKILNVFYDNKEKNHNKDNPKKILLSNCNLEENEEKKSLINYKKSIIKNKRDRTLDEKPNRKNIFSEIGKSILENNRSNSILKKSKTKLVLKINEDSDNDNSIKCSYHYKDDNSKDDDKKYNSKYDKDDSEQDVKYKDKDKDNYDNKNDDKSENNEYYKLLSEIKKCKETLNNREKENKKYISELSILENRVLNLISNKTNIKMKMNNDSSSKPNNQNNNYIREIPNNQKNNYRREIPNKRNNNYRREIPYNQNNNYRREIQYNQNNNYKRYIPNGQIRYLRSNESNDREYDSINESYNEGTIYAPASRENDSIYESYDDGTIYVPKSREYDSICEPNERINNFRRYKLYEEGHNFRRYKLYEQRNNFRRYESYESYGQGYRRNNLRPRLYL